MVYKFKDLSIIELKEMLQLSTDYKCVRKGKTPIYYTGDSIGFDIETTNKDEHHAYMYHWQLSFNKDIILGRTWAELEIVFLILSNQLLKFKRQDNYTHKVLVWVANLGFEFQFLRKRFETSNLFAKEKRKPLKFDLFHTLEFRDALAITGGNLESLAKNYCKTLKMVGDLDYSIERSNLTPLTEKEEKYCINDVVILSEWNDYINRTYVDKGIQVPLTKTAIVRNKVKKAIPPKRMYYIKQDISNMYPGTQKEYDLYMRFLYKGGYAHANLRLANMVHTKCGAYDFTSSYPSVMLDKCYPMSPFTKCEFVNSLEDITRLSDRFCFIFCVRFEKIESTTAHSIESEHKCIELNCDSWDIDNGRVHKAEKMTVLLTELDFQYYRKFYKWEKAKILFCNYAIKGYLPNYLVKTMLQDYTRKNELKQNGQSKTLEYALCKADVNSYYGMCCTRMSLTSYTTDEEGEWTEEPSKDDYSKYTSKQVLSPFWGIYVSSKARCNLLLNLYELREYVVCTDTDSLKLCTVNEKIKSKIDAYNQTIIERNKEISVRLGVPFELISDLGCFDDETGGVPIKRLKTLGAKRYLYEDDKGVHPVIAGLPKHSFVKYCEDNPKINPFELFDNDMMFDVDISGKSKAYYEDKPHTDIVDGVKMSELSSCAISNTKFQLKLSETYKMLLERNIERMEDKHFETRIY